MNTYYISGPMRNVPEHNYPTFIAVERALAASLECDRETGKNWAELQANGFEILNPARNFDGDKTRSINEYMRLDLEMVMRADTIVLLPGWETSEGAMREVQLATWLGKGFMVAELYQECATDMGVAQDWRFRDIDVPTINQSPRSSALEEAHQLITGDRNNQYGPPTQDFVRTAGMAAAFGFQVNGKPLQPHHVAIFMMLLKVSRLAWTPEKRDSWVDAAGYAGCGYEVATEEAKQINVVLDHSQCNEDCDTIRAEAA